MFLTALRGSSSRSTVLGQRGDDVQGWRGLMAPRPPQRRADPVPPAGLQSRKSRLQLLESLRRQIFGFDQLLVGRFPGPRRRRLCRPRVSPRRPTDGAREPLARRQHRGRVPVQNAPVTLLRVEAVSGGPGNRELRTGDAQIPRRDTCHLLCGDCHEPRVSADTDIHHRQRPVRTCMLAAPVGETRTRQLKLSSREPHGESDPSLRQASGCSPASGARLNISMSISMFVWLSMTRANSSVWIYPMPSASGPTCPRSDMCSRRRRRPAPWEIRTACGSRQPCWTAMNSAYVTPPGSWALHRRWSPIICGSSGVPVS